VRFVDGRERDARIVGTDSETDLALLKVDPKGDRLVPLPIADASTVKVGHLCMAVGSPFGLSNSVTVGTVSAKHRSAQLNLPYQDFLQTDAAINPGNSGGALVNIRGQLIGINTAIVGESRGSDGVGFAIPSNVVRWVRDQLLAHGRVRRGFLGVKSIDFGDDLLDYLRERKGVRTSEELLQGLGLGAPRGVYLFEVERQSPAGKAGVREGDVLLELGGKPILGQSDLLFKVAELAPGSEVAVKVLRERKERTISVELGERPPVDLRRRRR
jgi:S1-C subfamily serine protease